MGKKSYLPLTKELGCVSWRTHTGYCKGAPLGEEFDGLLFEPQIKSPINSSVLWDNKFPFFVTSQRMGFGLLQPDESYLAHPDIANSFR